jgi:hypothetical protein
VKDALAAVEPAISVDTKKKELVGDFKNNGRAWRPKGRPEPVRVHDFIFPELGRAAPYGDAGWVSVGIDNDTASFAVNSIRRWWKTMGRVLPYPSGGAPPDGYQILTSAFELAVGRTSARRLAPLGPWTGLWAAHNSVLVDCSGAAPIARFGPDVGVEQVGYRFPQFT